MLHLLDHIKSDRPPEDDDSAISDQWTVISRG
jgi:ribosome-binding factor A